MLDVDKDRRDAESLGAGSIPGASVWSFRPVRSWRHMMVI